MQSIHKSLTADILSSSRQKETENVIRRAPCLSRGDKIPISICKLLEREIKNSPKSYTPEYYWQRLSTYSSQRYAFSTRRWPKRLNGIKIPEEKSNLKEMEWTLIMINKEQGKAVAHRHEDAVRWQLLLCTQGATWVVTLPPRHPKISLKSLVAPE